MDVDEKTQGMGADDIKGTGAGKGAAGTVPPDSPFLALLDRAQPAGLPENPFRQPSRPRFHFLVDLENVQHRWPDALDVAKEGDTVHFFWTEHAHRLGAAGLSQLFEKRISIQMHECGTGPNALDFQLASELGCLASMYMMDIFVIVSDDSGYDVLVGYWARKNIKVRRRPVETAHAAPSPVQDAAGPCPPPAACPVPDDTGRALREKQDQCIECYTGQLYGLLQAHGYGRKHLAHFIGCLKSPAVNRLDGQSRCRRIRQDTVNRFGTDLPYLAVSQRLGRLFTECPYPLG